MREDTYVARFLIMFVFVVSFLGCASLWRLRLSEKEERELEGQRPHD